MSDKDRIEEQQNDDQTVARLMHLAGPRAAIPADVERRVYGAVRSEWELSTRRRNLARWTLPLALAASVIVAVGLLQREPVAPLVAVGTISRVTGPAAGLAVGDPVHRGATLRTGPGQGLSITTSDGVSLRVASGTEFTLKAADAISIAAGEIYADSGERAYLDRHMSIDTPIGSATDVGTQFSVRYSGDAMSVAVREGRVNVIDQQDQPSARIADVGERLVLRPGQDVTMERVSVRDPSWGWAVALAPAFDIESASLLDFLKWAARETARELVFEDDDLRMEAMRTVLHGSVTDFTPDEAAESVLSTTGFRYRIDEQRIVITR
ncbi:MAG: FecR domain-containing protein [Gammaproteobacteria bacterium]|nr:FecR domain-containing protein [Gammaproteobacteria bacterium]MDH4255874.1 FecR domain-containing protein [Gammaproteobacteria bacterium]MDH5309477.1 FecR domain-containing protein [Gammaproteobacteria bacterium]